VSDTTGEIDPQEFRRLDLEGPVNFRDLGGYETADGRTVRRRHLFRSDALFRLTESDAEQVRALGVTTLIDFRTPDELEQHGFGGMDHLDAEHLHLPTIDTTRRVIDLTDDASAEVSEEIARALVTAADAYMMMLDRGSNAYAEALRVVASSDAPVVFFCAAGKDRTGVFAALVLGLLGVSDDDIVTDYALTHDVIEKIHILRAGTMSEEDNERMSAYASLIGEDLRNAYPASMQTTIERLNERYGGWVGYATEIGVGADVLDQLRARLLV
jgi:protein-tyrosine phosphatase